jgi:membrane protein YqaA with SNARE-associated domain
MFRKLYEWLMRLAGTRQAPAALFVVSFAESSFFPIPPDALLGPMVLARRDKAYVYAALCTLASVLGGMAGYAIGFYLEPVAERLLAILGHPEGRQEFERWFDQWGLWIILVKGVIFIIPYKLVTIASGLAHFDFFTFVWASVITRSVRFFAVAGVLKHFGPAMLAEFEKRINLYSVLLLALLVALIVALKVFL